MNNVTELMKVMSAYERAINSAHQSVRVGRIYKKVFDHPKYEYMYPLLNNRLFTSLNILDLLIGLKHIDQYQATGNMLEANYFARIVALNAHEALEAIPILSNQKIRQFIMAQIGEEGIKEIDELIKTLNVLKRTHLFELKKIRNNVVGHKLSDSLEQSDIIQQIDTKKVYAIGNSLVATLLKLVGSFTNVLEKLPQPDSTSG